MHRRLPALAAARLRVVIGTIFTGAVHDFGALVVSVREKGRSIPNLANLVLGGRARSCSSPSCSSSPG